MSTPAKLAERSLPAPQKQPRPSIVAKARYLARIFPGLVRQRISRQHSTGRTHLIITIADHFEPAIVPGHGQKRATQDVQEQRLERWCKEYPVLAREWCDSGGHPLQHTYFYPAEQFNRTLIDQLAEHCREGWGEVEIHLHHGLDAPDTPENMRRVIVEFRNELEMRGALCYLDGAGPGRYAFVHGNFALANCAGGRMCGVDSELQILAESGCYADLTLPAAAFADAQISKTNSLYECSPPLNRRAAHSSGLDLKVGCSPKVFPLLVQGPLLLTRSGGRVRIENGALVGANPPSLRRLQLWKRAGISVKGRPDWIFIKLHCHSMDPTHEPATLGDGMRSFLRDLVNGAKDRNEVLHFTSAREMVNIAFAACDGREGNPGEFRDYRLKRFREIETKQTSINAEATARI